MTNEEIIDRKKRNRKVHKLRVSKLTVPVGLKMLVKHSSARWLAFVFSKMSMRNLRTFKLLSKPLERDVIVENWELAMLTCEPFSEQTKRVVNSRK